VGCASYGASHATRTHARGNLLGVHIGVYQPYYCLKTGITQ